MSLTGTEHGWLAENHKVLSTGLRTGATNNTPASPNQTSGGGVPIHWLVRKIAEIQAAIAAQIAASVLLAEAAGVNADTLANIQEEAYKAAYVDATEGDAARQAELDAYAASLE